MLWKFSSKVIHLLESEFPFPQSKIKSHLSFSDFGPKELPLPRFMMSKTDSDIRFGNSAEPHGTKAQIPYLISEKNTFKRMDDEDKQVNNLIRHIHLTDHETSCSSASYLLSSFQQISPSGLQLQIWK